MSPELEALKLRDPDHFFFGGLHQNVKAWDTVLLIGRWIQDKVHIFKLARPFSSISESNSLQVCQLQSGFQTICWAESSRVYISGDYSSCYYRSVQGMGESWC